MRAISCFSALKKGSPTALSATNKSSFFLHAPIFSILHTPIYSATNLHTRMENYFQKHFKHEQTIKQ